MQLIFSILRAAHCRSTHHYFAIDALRKLPTAYAQRLGQLLLKYHDDYLEGAKAPDARFKDFQNHVIHVSDNNWGGAADKCFEWQKTALNLLNEKKWKKAAYACGVLSHYFTDPIMPLHTSQCPKESEVHRPIEWSVFKSYNQIYQLAEKQDSSAQFQLASDEHWIGKAVLALAQISHRQYEEVINHYHLPSAISLPNYGLNDQLLNTFASLFTLAIDGWRAVLARLADETTAELPCTKLRLPTLLAAIDMPLAWIVGRISDSHERRAVAAALREYEQSGKVTRHIAEEIPVIHRAKSTLAKKALLPLQSSPSTNSENPPSLTDPPPEQRQIVKVDRHRLLNQLLERPQDVQSPELIPSGTPAPEPTLNLEEVNPPNDDTLNPSEQPVFLSLAQARAKLKGHPPIFRALDDIQRELETPVESGGATQFENQTSWESALIEAPSIGPKTAKRFEKIGVGTIGQFLAENPDELESRLQTRWITADVIGQWQDQARLICETPILHGYQAQLLVAIGCRSAWQLRTANTNQLQSQLSQFCQTSEGQQILLEASIPSEVDVKSWIDSARRHARRKSA